MSARFALLLPILGLIPTPKPAPVTTRYRLETRIDQVIDMTALGEAEQKNSLVQVALISVTLTDSAGGRSMHVVVDSIALDGPIPTPPEAIKAAKGAWLHGFIDGSGRVTKLSAVDDSSDILSQLKTTMQTFHPRLKPGFKAGDVWTDTATVETKSSSQKAKTNLITNYTARGEETVGEAKALRLETKFTAKATGTVSNPMAGEMQLETTETGTGVYHVTADGRFLGGEVKATGDAKVSSPALPSAIPIKVTRTSTVTVIK